MADFGDFPRNLFGSDVMLDIEDRELGEIDEDFLNEFDLDDILQSFAGSLTEEVLPYPHGEKETALCKVCFDTATAHLRYCCRQLVCDDCIREYCVTDVKQGILKIHCPIAHCKSFLTKDEIVYRLPSDVKEKFHKYLTDANKDPCVKTCPRCSHITKLGDRASELDRRKVKKYGLKYECVECKLEWCFPCQAPWHESITCKQFRIGDKLVKDWAQTLHHGSKNAQRCPKCKVFIERTEGCDHMHCSRCDTEFCYRCGDKYRSMKFIGNHHDRFSVFGCKYQLRQGKPNERKLIRGAILGGKILALPCVTVLAVGVGAILLLGGAIIGPFYGGYKLHQARMRLKKSKAKYNAFLRQRRENEGRISSLRGLRIADDLMPTGTFRSMRDDFSLQSMRLGNVDTEEDESLEFYDVTLTREILQQIKMRRADLPMNPFYATDSITDSPKSDSSSESSLSNWSDDEDNVIMSRVKRRLAMQKFRLANRRSQMASQPRSRTVSDSSSSDSEFEEIDSGKMFVIDSAGKVYTSENSSLRASNDKLVEYVAAVSETTHL